MTRARPIRWLAPVGRPLATAAFAALALLSLARPVGADEPLRYNCPAGFVWIRMSGTACVQETVPANGKIGYDGHGVCIEPYVGIFEFRPTTDGKGVPGNPATSYSYLLECVTQEEAARRSAAATAAGPPGDLTKLLAGGPVELPPAGDLVVVGVTATGSLLVAASRFRPAPKPATAPTGPSSPPVTPGPAPEPATGEVAEAGSALPLPTDPAEVRRKLDELAAYDATLAQLADKIRVDAAAGRLTPIDYVTFLGMLADVVAAVPFPPTQLAAGGVSIGASLSLAIADAADWDTRAIDRDLRGRLVDIGRMRGIVAADTDVLKGRLEAVDRPPEQVPGRVDVDPASLPDQMLRDERERAEQRVDQTYRADHANDAEVLRLMDERSRAEDQVRDLRRALDAWDASRSSTTREIAADETTGGDLAASIDGFIQKWGEDAERALMREAREAMNATVDSGEFFEHARGFRAAREAADGMKTAGHVASAAGVVAAGATGLQWYQEYSAEQQRAIAERVVEDLAHQAGKLGQQLVRADEAARQTAATFRDAAAHRDAVRAELVRRATERGHVLWTQ